MRPAIRPTSERVYTAVKAQLLNGAFLPGERIDAAQLAGRHGASVTPVRAALHHLAGERLVEARAGEGFHAPRVTEAGLRDLYAWNGHLLQLAWQLSPQAGGSVARRGLAADGDLESLDLIAGTERLFAAVGGWSGNAPCAEAIDGLNDRLHLARGLESRPFIDAADELTKLTDVLASGPSSDVRQAITHYHRRRMRAAPELVRLMHQRRDQP